MTLLTQQELLVPPPRERIIVPRGETAIWGIDPSSVRIAIAAHHDDVTSVRMASFPTVPGAPRLSAIYEETRASAHELADTAPPGLILVEQPSGPSSRGVNHELEFAVGVIIAGLYDGAYQSLRHGVKVRLVTSSWWKKRACGRGNISKPTRKKLGRTPQFGDYGVAVWARENGYQGFSWDEADAWGICTAGVRDVALEPR